MAIDIAGWQSDKYNISTSTYEGPLDLLLKLIERAELDITSLALAQVTDQYLTHLENIKHHNPAEVSAFLVIAARLLQIKSSALLPRPILVDIPTEEETGEALARQLIQYRRFKQLAGILSEREEKGLRTYLRIATSFTKSDTKYDLTGITLHDLLVAARQILVNRNELSKLNNVVLTPRITIREKITTIIETLRRLGNTKFRFILQQTNRLETVVTFLAMLELIKRQIIQVQQDNLFGDIDLIPTGALEDMIETESEFGD